MLRQNAHWRMHALPVGLRLILFVLAVDCGAYWLEWLIVTPRFHRPHHGDDPRVAGKNLGMLFDRLG